MKQIGIELFKVRTQRASVMILGAAVILSILGFVLTAIALRLGVAQGLDLSNEALQRQLLGLGGGSVLMVVFCVVGITGEYRHRTIGSTFLATPVRHRVLIGKLFAYMIVAVLYGVVVAFIATGGVMLLLAVEGVPLLVSWGQILRDYLRDLVGLVLYAGFGFGVGALVANQIAGIVIVLVESFIVSPLVAAIFPSVGRFFPSQAINAFLSEAEFAFPGSLSPAVGGLVFLAWVVQLVAAAIYLTQRRDIT